MSVQDVRSEHGYGVAPGAGGVGCKFGPLLFGHTMLMSFATT